VGVDRADFGAGFPENGLFVRADISNPQDIETIYQQASAFAGVLDVVVNNAAMQITRPLVETSVEEWDLVMASTCVRCFWAPSWPIRCWWRRAAGRL